jgi:hypothetical protein
LAGILVKKIGFAGGRAYAVSADNYNKFEFLLLLMKSARGKDALAPGVPRSQKRRSQNTAAKQAERNK